MDAGTHLPAIVHPPLCRYLLEYVNGQFPIYTSAYAHPYLADSANTSVRLNLFIYKPNS